MATRSQIYTNLESEEVVEVICKRFKTEYDGEMNTTLHQQVVQGCDDKQCFNGIVNNNDVAAYTNTSIISSSSSYSAHTSEQQVYQTKEEQLSNTTIYDYAFSVPDHYSEINDDNYWDCFYRNEVVGDIETESFIIRNTSYQDLSNQLVLDEQSKLKQTRKMSSNYKLLLPELNQNLYHNNEYEQEHSNNGYDIPQRNNYSSRLIQFDFIRTIMRQIDKDSGGNEMDIEEQLFEYKDRSTYDFLADDGPNEKHILQKIQFLLMNEIVQLNSRQSHNDEAINIMNTFNEKNEPILFEESPREMNVNYFEQCSFD